MTFVYWILGIIGYVGLACLAGRWIGGPDGNCGLSWLARIGQILWWIGNLKP